MVEKTYGTLGGLKVPVLVYESYEESDKAAGKLNATLDSANDNFHYRGGPAADTREWICETLEKDTSIERKTKPVLGKDGQPRKDAQGNVVLDWDENEGDFVRRVAGRMNWRDLKLPDEYQDKLNAWAKTANDGGTPLAVSAKAAERVAKAPPKLAGKFKSAAAVSIAIGTVDAVNRNQLSKIGKSFTPTGDTSKMFTGTAVLKSGKQIPFSVSDKDAESLGWLLREYREWSDQQEMEQIMSAATAPSA